MRLLATSASGANGEGYSAILAFSAEGDLLGPFSQDARISDPRGLSLHPTDPLIYVNSGADRILALNDDGEVALDSGCIPDLDPGGAVFGPDRRYYLTARRRGTVLALPANLEAEAKVVVPEGTVAFPRGFGFGPQGQFYLSSGVGPSGEGDSSIAVFVPDGAGLSKPRLIRDPEMSPLDLVVAPNGNVVVSSEWPFGAHHGLATVREYEPTTGRLVRVLSPDPGVGFAEPRGLRLSGNHLFCVGRDHIVVFEFSTGAFLGVVAQLSNLRGQSIAVLVD